MLKKDVVIGAHYAIAHTSYNKLSVIRIDSESQYGGYNATKLSTGRPIRVKSAAKLRSEVVLNPDYQAGNSPVKWIVKK
jgi:hypothetical protein